MVFEADWETITMVRRGAGISRRRRGVPVAGLIASALVLAGLVPAPAGAQTVPPNDAFAAAQVVSGGSGSVTGSNVGATKEPGEPNPIPNNTGGASVWYRWTAPATGQATITTVGSSFDTILAVSTGTSVSALTPIASNDDLSGSSAQSAVAFAAVAGTTYRIDVDGWRTGPVTASGSIKLNWSQSAPPAGPPNDAFAAPEVIAGASGTIAGTTVAATKEPGEPNPVPNNTGGASVWYRWTAPATGQATITTVGSSFDTLLAVYTGSAVTALTKVASNDDISGAVVQSSATFAAASGTTYRIVVDGWRTGSTTATGAVTLDWNVSAPPAGPPNDAFANAQAIAGAAGNVAGTNVAATKESGEPKHVPTNPGGASVWFQWVAPSTGDMTITTTGSTFDTGLAVYTGTSVGNLTSVAWNDDISGSEYQSSLTFAAVSGTTYRVAVDGWRTRGSVATGAIALGWSLVVPPPAPPNDRFASAEVITGGTGDVTGTNVGATKESGEPKHTSNNEGGASIWYRWEAPRNGDVTISTTGSAFDTVLAVYTGSSVGSLTRVAANDDLAPTVFQSRVTFAADAGETYRIAVDGWRNSAGVTATGVVHLDWTLVGASDAVLAAAGDVASCSTGFDEMTGGLLAALPGATVAMLGDGVYPNGTAQEYADCYDPSWGQVKSRTRPTPGHHDYATPGAAGYFGYFGAAAGDPTQGYYSYDLGSWHIVVLNAICGEVGGCGEGSPQNQWLEADLAANPSACTLAYWHTPLFSSGDEGVDPAVRPLWDDLYDHGADVIVNGHEHVYERFALQRPDGTADPEQGIREFVVGTGGITPHGSFSGAAPNSEVRDSTSHGVLTLTLRPHGYDWRFAPVGGSSFRDSGAQSCHHAT